MTVMSPAAAPAPFDPTVPVGEGITVLEASAGTGKTHAVASLVVAEVAVGRPLEEMLIVTFTRKATGTLRERVWQRLADAASTLAPIPSRRPTRSWPIWPKVPVTRWPGDGHA